MNFFSKILKAVGWERVGNVEAESGLADLTEMVILLNVMEDADAVFFSCGEIPLLAKKLDDVLGFLHATSDALAAMSRGTVDPDGDDSGPPIIQ